MAGELLEGAAWSWGLSLILLTIALHATGVVVMAFLDARIQVRVREEKLGTARAIPVVIGAVGTVGVVLAALHGLEAMLWAGAYVWVGALGSFAEAVLYSLGSMTTRGSSVDLLWRWQMMGVLEAVNGMLLFGISTAFIFACMQSYWPMLARRG